MAFVVSTAPTEEPVKLEEAKAHLHVDGTDQDLVIAGFIAAARQHIEKVCERALMPQSWTLVLDAFPSECPVIELPGGLVRAITSLKYIDTDGTEQTVSGANYQADLLRQPARLAPLFDEDWPVTRSGQLNAVKVVYEVGYAKASEVPAPLKAALLLIVGDLAENRESAIVGTIYSETPTVKALLWPYKRAVP